MLRQRDKETLILQQKTQDIMPEEEDSRAGKILKKNCTLSRHLDQRVD